MAAMEVFGALLVPDRKLPNTLATGTSKGNANAGTGNDAFGSSDATQTGPTTAGISPTICLGALLGSTCWLIRE